MDLFAADLMTRTQPLAALHDQVHRFTGVIDRFGSFLQNGASIRTLCLRELRLASSQQPLDPDHWWFAHREIWSEAGIRSGDTVLFTAKVQRCTKGWHDPRNHCSANPRRQVLGFSATPRSVVVVRRHEGDRHQVAALESALAECQQHLSDTIRQHQQLTALYAAVLKRHQALQQLTWCACQPIPAAADALSIPRALQHDPIALRNIGVFGDL